MKVLNKILSSFIFLLLITTSIYAHGGNISGWNDKNSNKITYYNEKHYGYHNENGVAHYHKVKWNEEKNRWDITSPSVYYEKDGESFKLLHNTLDKNLLTKDATFVESVDGDTAEFNIDGQTIRVRFLGIDTPETVHSTKPVEPYGPEASTFTKEHLANATSIRLEFEYDTNIFSEEDNKNKDMYGRLLAWVFIDDVLLQEELLKNGLGVTYMLTNSQKYTGVLQQAEEHAKENFIGIWSAEEYISSVTDKNDNANIIDNSSNLPDDSIVATIIAIILIVFLYLIKHYTKNVSKQKKSNKKKK